MKKVLLLTGLLTLAAVAAEPNQYSYQNQKRAYDEAKGNGQQQHQYRKGEENGNGQKNQYRYGQNGGKGGQGGGGMRRGGKR